MVPRFVLIFILVTLIVTPLVVGEQAEEDDYNIFNFKHLRCPQNTTKYCPMKLELPLCNVECYCHPHDKLDLAPFPDSKDFPAYTPFTCGPELIGKYCIRRGGRCHSNKDCDRHSSCDRGTPHFKSEGNQCYRLKKEEIRL